MHIPVEVLKLIENVCLCSFHRAINFVIIKIGRIASQESVL